MLAAHLDSILPPDALADAPEFQSQWWLLFRRTLHLRQWNFRRVLTAERLKKWLPSKSRTIARLVSLLEKSGLNQPTATAPADSPLSVGSWLKTIEPSHS